MLAQPPYHRVARPARFAGLASVLLLWLWPAGAGAQEPHRYRFDAGQSARLVAGASLGAVVLRLGPPGPAECGWCEPGGFDLSLADGLDAGVHRDDYAAASDWGMWLTRLGAVAVAGGSGISLHDGDPAARAYENLSVVVEAALVTSLFTDLLKLSVGRKRPDAHFGQEGRRNPAYRNASFVSGHASHTAALGASVTTMAFLRGYVLRHGVLAGAASLTLAVGTLRVISTRHWPTDVLAGWLLGALVGVSLPLLLHPRHSGPAPGEGVSGALPLLNGQF